MPDSANLQPNDLHALWMLFTANHQFKTNPRMSDSARDMHDTAAEGRRILDGTVPHSP
jgi:beta-alanine--pyruvate transaminase